ncbi:MAG: replication-associated recombination protein A [Myxococcota bacterium]
MNNDTQPLAARMRPKTVDEVVGQEHLIGPDTPLRVALERGSITSLLLWGPPGCGKTSLARLLADHTGLKFLQMSAVMSGIKELRQILDRVKDIRTLEQRGSLLFVDEIHRWNKAQQDALLPHVEEGTIVLVGATTENPGFQIIPALRSRCWLLTLQPLTQQSLCSLISKAIADEDRGLGKLSLSLDQEAIEAIAQASSGDARRALSILERIALSSPEGSSLTRAAIVERLGKTDLLHDRDGDTHYDIASALIKSMRGSDPDAALYWTARLLEGGEDPMFIARRLVIFASEDVGNADTRALSVAVAAMQAVQLVGMPESRIILGQAVTYLATSPKSNRAYTAINDALETVRKTGPLPVPSHLRSNPTGAPASPGSEYKYPHDYPHHIVQQTYLPEDLTHVRFYEPVAHGGEKIIKERMAWVADQLKKRS